MYGPKIFKKRDIAYGRSLIRSFVFIDADPIPRCLLAPSDGNKYVRFGIAL